MELLEIGFKPIYLIMDILYTVYSNNLHVTSKKLTYTVYSIVSNPRYRGMVHTISSGFSHGRYPYRPCRAYFRITAEKKTFFRSLPAHYIKVISMVFVTLKTITINPELTVYYCFINQMPC